MTSAPGLSLARAGGQAQEIGHHLRHQVQPETLTINPVYQVADVPFLLPSSPPPTSPSTCLPRSSSSLAPYSSSTSTRLPRLPRLSHADNQQTRGVLLRGWQRLHVQGVAALPPSRSSCSSRCSFPSCSSTPSFSSPPSPARPPPPRGLSSAPSIQLRQHAVSCPPSERRRGRPPPPPPPCRHVRAV